MKPTRSTVRTLQNRRDRYTMLIWKATQGRGHDPKALAATLEAKPIQRLFRSRVALPFDTHPEECKKIVIKLAPRSLDVAAAKLSCIAGPRAAAGKAASSP